MLALYIVLGVIAFLILIYLFMICPASGKKAKAFDRMYIAHRGLHGGDVKENTAQAFENAVIKGFGVELDIHLSKDGIPVVHHDASLKRVFNVDKLVKDMTEAELNEIGVPSFITVLNILDGKVPLVAEIKGESLSTDVCKKSAELLDGYKGLYCVESFNPIHLRWFKKNRKNVIRGQLSTAFGKGKNEKFKLRDQFLRHLLLNFLSRPHFIAYEHKYFGLSVRLCKMLGAHMVCWTPRSKDECEKSKRHYSTYIFENFTPEI